MVRLSHLTRLSDEDAAWLYPGLPLPEVAAHLRSFGPQLVVITCGAKGATAWTASTVARQAAEPPERLLDTVGAGDAFTAALLSGLPTRLPGELATLDAEQLGTILSFANQVGRIACERAGSDPPTLRELASRAP